MYNFRCGDGTEGIGDGQDGRGGNIELERLVRFDGDAIFLTGGVEDGTEFTTEQAGDGRFAGFRSAHDVGLLFLANFEPARG